MHSCRLSGSVDPQSPIRNLMSVLGGQYCVVHNCSLFSEPFGLVKIAMFSLFVQLKKKIKKKTNGGGGGSSGGGGI